MVKTNIRADKRAYLDSLAAEAEETAHHGNKGAIYANIKKSSLEYLTSQRDLQKTPMGPRLLDEKDKEGDGWNTSRSF